MSRFIPSGLGWIPDLPDARDFTAGHSEIAPLLRRLKPGRRKKLPDAVDLRSDDDAEYFTSVENQGLLNASPAFAVLALLEYFERRIRGATFDGSALFLYQITQRVRQKAPSDERIPGSVPGNTGADLRTTLKVLASLGAPAESYWPTNLERFDLEPGPFEYSRAVTAAGLRYFRLDKPDCDGDATWNTVTAFLAAGFPVVFGFPVPSSLTVDPSIPYRPDLDTVRGGQAVVAIGYEHHHFGRGQHALRIRSSWGSQWGDNGNGWLPMAFVRNQLARDFWTVVSEGWLESGELTRP